MNFNEEPQVITLIDEEDGREIKLAVLEIFDFKDKTYALLADAENFENQDVLLVFVDGNNFNTIDSTEEFDAVLTYVKSKGK